MIRRDGVTDFFFTYCSFTSPPNTPTRVHAGSGMYYCFFSISPLSTKTLPRWEIATKFVLVLVYIPYVHHRSQHQPRPRPAPPPPCISARVEHRVVGGRLHAWMDATTQNQPRKRVRVKEVSLGYTEMLVCVYVWKYVCRTYVNICTYVRVHKRTIPECRKTLSTITTESEADVDT